MKNSITRISLLATFIASLTACGGGGSSNSAVSAYNGTWNGSCESISSTRSFKQTWELSGESLVSNVQVWFAAPSCNIGNAIAVKVKATLDYRDEVAVANTCSSGKAQQVDVTYEYLQRDGNKIEGEQNIQDLLTSQGISNALPKYGLICKGDDGKLYRGLLTADKDSSTPAKRPTEMDTTNPLVP